LDSWKRFVLLNFRLRKIGPVTVRALFQRKRKRKREKERKKERKKKRKKVSK